MTLTASAQSSSLTASTSSLTFGATAEGTVGDSQTFTITNSGSVSVVFEGLNATQDFRVDQGVAPIPGLNPRQLQGGSLPPNTSCSVQVTFTPVVLGPPAVTSRTGQLQINDDIPASDTLTLALSGTALMPGSSGGGGGGCSDCGANPAQTPEADSIELFGLGLSTLIGYGLARFHRRNAAPNRDNKP
jgi:hypothetical protein